MKVISGRTMTIMMGVICIILTVTLTATTINYNTILNVKETTISNLTSQVTVKDAQILENENMILSLNNQVEGQEAKIQVLTNQNSELQTWLDGNITALNAQIIALQNQTVTLKSQIDNLRSHASTLKSQVTLLQDQTLSDQNTIANLQDQIVNATAQIDALNSTKIDLQNQVEEYTSIINMSKSQLHTLVFHVCEKGDGHLGRLPDVNTTYDQLLALINDTYNVLLLPEYKSHSNWTEELSWLTANFGGKEGIPIMLDVFVSAEDSNPITMLSTDDILAAMATCNVQYVRIFEVISWHIEHEQPFPADYVKTILEFCKTNGLKVFWSEWKTDYLPTVETFTAIQNYIAGYEDMVTVAFATNSHEEQPPDGLLELHTMFPHFGASIQAWYWDTYHNSDPINMPAPLLVQHALSAKYIGAEIIQFEPYWYFFDNGQANENLELLQIMLTNTSIIEKGKV